VTCRGCHIASLLFSSPLLSRSWKPTDSTLEQQQSGSVGKDQIPLPSSLALNEEEDGEEGHDTHSGQDSSNIC
jgi:hypothetical protein